MASAPVVVTLNVGGILYTTTATTLTHYGQSMLGIKFSGQYSADQSPDGTYFIDRNGQLFSYVLDFLRNGPHWLAPSQDLLLCKRLLHEFGYYGLPTEQLHAVCYPQPKPSPFTPGSSYLICTGGECKDGTSYPYVSMYDPASDRWCVLDNLPSPARRHVGLTLIGDHLFIVGGISGSSTLPKDSATGPVTAGVQGTGQNKVEVYNLQSREFKEVAPMMAGRDHLTAVTLGDRIYAIGGDNPEPAQASCMELYDPEADRWWNWHRFGYPTQFAAVGHGQTDLYMLSHCLDQQNGLECAFTRYDVRTKVGVDLTLPDGHVVEQFKLASRGNYIQLFGLDQWQYDIRADSWLEMTSGTPYYFGDAGCAGMGDQTFILGGYDSENYSLGEGFGSSLCVTTQPNNWALLQPLDRCVRNPSMVGYCPN